MLDSLFDLTPALPEVFLACAGMALLMIGVFRGGDPTRTVSYLAVLCLAIAAALVVIGGDDTVTAFGGLFVVDGFATFAKLLILLATALAIVMSQGFIHRERMARFEYTVLILFAALGMLLSLIHISEPTRPTT